ncbi:MAG: EAL domain-containing protein [Deltaproteobacteria bacterium]|nr:EAL domain-containing protein [Deltaproteobacteria bacterium]
MPAHTIFLTLTGNEEEWLERHHREVVVLFDQNFPPLLYPASDGQTQGLAVELLSRMEKRLGLTFARKRVGSSTEIESELRSGRAVIVPAFVNTPRRNKYTLFTPPYIDIPLAVIARKGLKEKTSLSDFRGMRVAVKQGPAAELLNDRFPGFFEIVEVETIRKGLWDVSFGVVDAMVANLASASHFIDREGLPNLQVVNDEGILFPVCFATGARQPVLHAILAKTLADIPRSQIEELRKLWLKNPLITTERLRFLRLTLVLSGVAMLLFFLNAQWLKRKLQKSLRTISRQESRLRSLVEEAPLGIFTSTLDEGGRYLEANGKMAEILGYPSREALLSGVTSIRDQLYANPERRSQFLARIRRDGKIINEELEFKRPDGSRCWISLNMRRATRSNGAPVLEGFCQDISDLLTLREAEAEANRQMEFKAYHDPLTSLGNRRGCLKDLHEWLGNPGRGPLALLFFDIDHFKDINHIYGFSMGDALLIQVAERLKSIQETTGKAYRVGGDHFAAIGPAASFQEALELGNRIRDALNNRFQLEREQIEVSFSFGLAWQTPQEENADQLLNRATAAHHVAKRSEADHIIPYDQPLREQQLRRIAINRNLRGALFRGEFTLVYQPIMDARDNGLYGFEALLRWNSRAHGPINPAEFIPIAEESGQIVALGEFVLERACRFWTASGLAERELELSVNVCGKQFAQEGFLKQLKTILYRTQMPPHLLKLEITETALMKNARDTAVKLEQLKILGVAISIDDFGTGYSSLDYLGRFAADTLKIDMSFIQKMETDEKSLELVKAMTHLADTFNMDVVAEGVETEGQKTLLDTLGCRFHQGFYFSSPVPEPELMEYIRRHSPDSDRQALP